MPWDGESVLSSAGDLMMALAEVQAHELEASGHLAAATTSAVTGSALHAEAFVITALGNHGTGAFAHEVSHQILADAAHHAHAAADAAHAAWDAFAVGGPHAPPKEPMQHTK